jgi:hypothetical protein
MTKLYALAKHDKTSLIPWLTESFKSYFDIKHWLEENGIDFDK